MEQPVTIRNTAPIIGGQEQIEKTGELALRFAVEQGTADRPEIFDTIQGEGRNIGTPVVFARLSGCNLQCSWCDTPYTWAFTDRLAEKHDEGLTYDRGGEQVEVQVGDAIDQISGYSIKRAVITGGEPMLQQKGVLKLVKGLKEKEEDYWVEIETNGTIAPSQELIDEVGQFNVSPKLANSGNMPNKRRKDEALEAFVLSDKADFKFVVSGPDDITEILELVLDHQIPPQKVFLMPEGRTEEEVTKHTQELVELAKAYNFNVTTRLHVLIWGAKRGV